MQSFQCGSCAHNYLNVGIAVADRELIMPNGCRAYLGGIPPEVLGGEVDHRQEYDGDGGFTWAQAEGKAFPYEREESEPDELVPSTSSQCSFCQNLINQAEMKCKAFDVIPLPIWLAEVDHTTEQPGDGGFRFMPF